MKLIFTLISFLLLHTLSIAQQCTTSNFDACAGNNAVTAKFSNATLIPGTGNALTVGSKYKYEYAIPGLNLDAVLTIDEIVNVIIVKLDDDQALSGSVPQPSLFTPVIMPAQKLGCSSSNGYVTFSVQFYTHYNGLLVPQSGLEMAVAGLSLLNYDMDGFTIGNNGWLKEWHSVKISGADPANYFTPGTEVEPANFTPGWILAYGSTRDRNGIALCNEVTEKTIYSNPQTAISFRLGYDYKAPDNGCDASLQPARDYAVKMGCFYLPAAGPLPVSLINFSGNNVNGKNELHWVSLQEHDISNYEIQRSTDGINYETAGTVKANDLTSSQDYYFTDPVTSFNAKNVYYRIRIVDIEHSMKLTNTVIIKMPVPKASVMTITPNPSSNQAQLHITLTEGGKGNIVISDISGRIIGTQQEVLAQGSNTILLKDITALSEGCYTIQLTVNNEHFTSKLMVWK